MKKLLTLGVVGLAVAVAVPVSASSLTGLISREQAREIAFTHAGVTSADVIFDHVTLDFDDDGIEYDVEFFVGNVEYDYEISAVTGEILDVDHEVDNNLMKVLIAAGLFGNTQNTATAPVTAPTPVATTAPVATTQQTGYLTKDQAKAIAFAHAGTTDSTIRELEIEFDHDDGKAIYEIEWKVGNVEYECDLDAVTGAIYKFEIDRD